MRENVRVLLLKQIPITIYLYLERSTEFLAQTQTGTSIERYDHILEQLESENVMCILAQTKILTRQNLTQANPQMNYSEIISKCYLPTITKASRITKTTFTFTDNIYVKCKKPHNIISGLINSHISD